MTQLPARLKGAHSAALRHALGVRFRKFLFVFDLRQGAILVAVQNIAVSGCTLVMLLVGIAHALETLNVLNADMEDNAEREGALLVTDDDLSLLRDGPAQVTNNQKKFRVAYHLAIMMVFFLYSSLVGAAVYLVFCVGLFYGAAKRKKEYVLPWIVYASFSLLLLIGALVVGDKSDTVVRICGGRSLYRFSGALLVACHVYCVVAVASFACELRAADAEKKPVPPPPLSDERALIVEDGVKTSRAEAERV